MVVSKEAEGGRESEPRYTPALNQGQKKAMDQFQDISWD
jgi:hypothetical protein